MSWLRSRCLECRAPRLVTEFPMDKPAAKKRLRRGLKSHKKETNPRGKRAYVQDSGVDALVLQDAEGSFEPNIPYPDERSDSGSS